MGHGKRTTIGENLTRDEQRGIIEAVVRVGPLRDRKTWPLDVWETDAGRARIEAFVPAARERLQQQLAAFGPAALTRHTVGTLEAAVAFYLVQIAGRATFKSDRSNIYAWLNVTLPPPFDPRPLREWQTDDITAAVINAAIGIWQTEGSTPGAIRMVRVAGHARGPVDATKTIANHVRAVPATSRGKTVATATIIHRARVLRELFRKLLGKKNAHTPVCDSDVPEKIRHLKPTTIADELLVSILVKLFAICPKTFARYAVACITGQRPVQVKKATPDDVKLDARRWLVANAKGERVHPIDLNLDAVLAWKEFATVVCYCCPECTKGSKAGAGAWGDFDSSHYGNLIHRAGLPPTIRPYNTRHSTAVAALDRGALMQHVSNLLGHHELAITEEHYTGYVAPPTDGIADRLQGRFSSVFGPRLVGKR